MAALHNVQTRSTDKHDGNIVMCFVCEAILVGVQVLKNISPTTQMHSLTLGALTMLHVKLMCIKSLMYAITYEPK